jgi:2-methylcitrate dehydratase
MARRRFLAQVTATGASAVALPALAAEGTAGSPAPALPSARTSIAEALADYAMALRYEDLPPEIVRIAKRSIIDTLGCAIGAFSVEPAQIAVRLAAHVSASPGAGVLCAGTRTSPELAVFANGVMIRYLDFNDGYISLGSGHPSDSIAALLSAAEVMGRSGRDLILATVLAYEVYCKVTDVLDNQALGLDNATVAGLAAVVGAGRLYGLTRGQLVHAISLAVAGNTAVSQTRRGVLSSWKACSSADACRNAIFAVQLAQAGMTGPGQVFEGREGFFNLVKLRPFALPALGGNGEPFGIMHAYTKLFALGQYAQTAAQAAMQARSFFSDVSEIEEINLRVSHNAIKIMADVPDKWRPQTHETADHSLPYSVAVILKYGEIDAQYYDDKYLHDPRLLDLVSRVRCLPSEEADRRQQEINLCDLEIVLKSGQRKSIRAEYHRGHWKNPMTDAEMEQKFRSLARHQLRPQKIDALLKQLWALEQMPKAGALIGMTRV